MKNVDVHDLSEKDAEFVQKIVELVRERVRREGRSPISPNIARSLVEAIQSPRSDEQSEMTAREEEIHSLLFQGYKYREIASMLFISIDTVRAHVRHIYEKLHVNSRYQLILRKGSRDKRG